MIGKQPHMKIVGEATNQKDALAVASREQPEIIILDIRLGLENGADIIPELLHIAEESRIIVLTGVVGRAVAPAADGTPYEKQ